MLQDNVAIGEEKQLNTELEASEVKSVAREQLEETKSRLPATALGR